MNPLYITGLGVAFLIVVFLIVLFQWAIAAIRGKA